MLRSLFAALLLMALAFAQASAGEKHKLALQISDNDPDKMNAVLNVAANVSKYYSDKGEEVDIQIVAFNAGLNMLLADTSPGEAEAQVLQGQHAKRLFHGVREHPGGNDPQSRQRAGTRRKRRARQGRRGHADRARRKRLDDRSALARGRETGGRPEAAT